MKELWNNIVTAWEAADRNARMLAVGGVAVVVIAVIIFSVWVTRADYQVLFADLEPRDGAAIVEELRRMKVPYRLADGGSKILVEEKLVHETRLTLMGRGVPLNGGIGFEIFDNKDVGMTEYTQRINYQRALQGELARTIMSINQVKHARVHLVVSDASIFKRQKVKPKASVSLVLKPGAALTAEQILGIQRLVSAAVSGMEPSAVTVLDQRGVTLSAAVEGDEGFASVSGQFKLKKNAEEYFVRKITEVLDRTFGPGQAIVSVDVTLNFDEIKRTSQTVIPIRPGSEAGAVVRKRESLYRQGKAPVAQAASGEAPSATASGQGLTSTTDIEYELGKSVEQVVSAPGGMRRVSVGIIVPKMNNQQLERMHSVVSMIVGFNETRGDAISIQPIDQLLTPEADTPPAADTSNASSAGSNVMARWLHNPGGVAAVLAIAILGSLFLGWLIAQRISRRREVTAASLTDQERQTRLAEIQKWLAAERAKEQR